MSLSPAVFSALAPPPFNIYLGSICSFPYNSEGSSFHYEVINAFGKGPRFFALCSLSLGLTFRVTFLNWRQELHQFRLWSNRCISFTAREIALLIRSAHSAIIGDYWVADRPIFIQMSRKQGPLNLNLCYILLLVNPVPPRRHLHTHPLLAFQSRVLSSYEAKLSSSVCLLSGWSYVWLSVLNLTLNLNLIMSAKS